MRSGFLKAEPLTESIIIPARFRGPPNSGNGGYVAGAIAERLVTPPGGAVEVTLRAPIPLDTPMTIERPDAHHLRVVRGETLIAEAAHTTLDLDVPAPPTFEAALAARPQSPSFYRDVNPLIPGGTGFHPICVCCGADVAADEGLHVYAAPVAGFDGVAAAWRTHPSLVGADGLLPEPIVWTALDCPGQFAYMARGIRTGLLGRMTGRMLRPVRGDADLVIIGWCLEVDGRKHFAGTALYDGDGTLCAYTRQTWIGRMD
jgi:acyl-coenzyme A thioesterase PaaI-like protein